MGAGAHSKTRQARWVPVPELVLGAVTGTMPREDRDLEAQVFAGFGADRFRTATARACKAAGVPVSPPMICVTGALNLWHLSGVPVAEASAWLGHSAAEHLKTYAHVVLDRTEIDIPKLLESVPDADDVFPPVFPLTRK